MKKKDHGNDRLYYPKRFKIAAVRNKRPSEWIEMPLLAHEYGFTALNLVTR